jgi:hypothetical protein
LGKWQGRLTELQKDGVYPLIHEFDESGGIPDTPKRDQYPKVAPAISNEMAATPLGNLRKSADLVAADLFSNGLSQSESWRDGNCRKSA